MKGNAKPERWERGEQADARGEEEKGDKTRRRTKPRYAPPGADRTAPRYAATPRAGKARQHPRGPAEAPNLTTAALSLSPTQPQLLLFPPSLPPAPRRLPCPGPFPPPTCGAEQRQPHQQHQRRRFHSATRAAPPPASPRLRRPPPRPARTAQQVKLGARHFRPAPARPRGVSPCPLARPPPGGFRLLCSRRGGCELPARPHVPTAERRRPVRLQSNDPRPGAAVPACYKAKPSVIAFSHRDMYEVVLTRVSRQKGRRWKCV